MRTQAELDQEMRDRSIKRGNSAAERRRRSSASADSPGSIALLRRAVEPVAQKIIEAQKNTGKAAFRGAEYPTLQKLNPYVTAYMALQECIEGAIRRASLFSVSVQTARAIELEINARWFETTHPGLFRGIVKGAREGKKGVKETERRVKKALKQNEKVEPKLELTLPEASRVGALIVGLVVEATGIIETELVSVGHKWKANKVKFGDGIADWLQDYNQAYALAKPMYLPMVEVPQDWVSIYKGGYKTKVAGANQGLVTNMQPEHEKALKKADLTFVYQALNAMQRTGWQVNRRVYEVMANAWTNSPDHPCLPRREDLPVPEFPVALQDDEPHSPGRKRWRAEARVIHNKNAQNRGRLAEFARNLLIAEDFLDEPRFFYVHHLDFRGRAYAVSNALSPQGSDQARGLIQFAQGKQLGLEGWRWLKIHGANLFGIDKVSFKDRVHWVDQHYNVIIDCARDPHTNLWWTEADDPWQFLAFCFEYAEALRLGPQNFVSHLPVHVDGSCNGIQHYAAMLRDPVAGKAVNLIPSDKPEDIYGEVAKAAEEYLRAIHENDPEFWVARAWVTFGIDRKIVKRAVMTVPYAVTYRSALKYIREAVQEKIESGATNPLGEDWLPRSHILGQAVWAAIGDVVISAREGMDYIQSVVELCNRHNKPLQWTAPSGFVCWQGYRDYKRRRIRTKFRGNLIYFTRHDYGKDLHKRRQVSASAPNFVHSMDAAALVFTILTAQGLGINSFSMIHDSYGTHACDMENLNIALRCGFVSIYEDKNWLAEFALQVAGELHPPNPPETGDLDIQDVLASPYFFA
ncbi:MAG: DNA-directed RNA polymerase [bacterium]